jgi:hypothetical protein
MTAQHFVARTSHHDAQIVLDCESNCGLNLCGIGWPRDESWLKFGIRVVFHVCQTKFIQISSNVTIISKICSNIESFQTIKA